MRAARQAASASFFEMYPCGTTPARETALTFRFVTGSVGEWATSSLPRTSTIEPSQRSMQYVWGGVSSFVKLHSSYTEALASSGRGRPKAVLIGDAGRVYSS